MENENWIVKLNERVQRTGLELKYEDLGDSGPDHIKTFRVRAVLNGKECPPGTGHNKKKAKQNAAKYALDMIEESADLQTENVEEASPAAVQQTNIQSYISWLNEYGSKNKLLIIPNESIHLEPNFPPLCCYFCVGENKFPAGYGKTKKEAKEAAAKLVYNDIMGNISTETGDEKYGSTPSRQKEESKQHVSESCNRTISPGVNKDSENFVGLINQYCQHRKLSHDFVLESKIGESHNPQFSFKLLINNKEYGLGQGQNKTKARQNAARQAWAVIQSNFDSKVNSLPGSEDIEPTTLATRPYKQETPDTDSENRPSSKGDSAMYTDSQSSAKYRDQSPGVRQKIKLAPTFQNVADRSKEQPLTFMKPKLNPSEGESHSRFTSEFDCMECLGHGTFGHVYKAKNKLLGKYFAVKILQYQEKTKREALALSDLHHPNIVRYYTCWIGDSCYQKDCTAVKHQTGSATKYLYIQMELCDSKTLREWIKEKNAENANTSSLDSKNREERLTIALQLASGVECIHSKNFIHRDLKPPNIMFGQDKNVKIGDFGLVTDENHDPENLIDRTAYKGTPPYMAPEQKSRKTYDRKVDIFALGLIYLELLWNITHESLQIWENVRNQIFPEEFCHEFPQESRIIRSMLCLQPEKRPEASKLKNDIEECTNALKQICSERHTV